jgi:hypothetical protein
MQKEMSVETSLFYDIFKTDKIGHKIVCTIECDTFNKNEMLIFMKKKAAEIMKKYPHLGCKCVDYSWKKVKNIKLDSMIVSLNKSHNEIIEKELDRPLSSKLPRWRIILTNNNCIMFICDHIYGDGAFIANMIRDLFSDKTLNNIPEPKYKKPIPLISKILLFFKIIYLLYKRFEGFKSPIPNDSNKSKHCCLAKLSLAELKNIRSRFSCSDGSHISINDILHTLLVYSNSLYFKKEMISSAAMFNMRENNGDYSNKNKIGYILLTNEAKKNTVPENVLRDVHDFMQFYKETPTIGIISKFIHSYYSWDREKASALVQNLNQSVDFIISNYALQYKDKYLQNDVKVINMSGCVTPCNAGQIYSINTYGDTITINLTYKCRKITDIKKLTQCFNDSLAWIKS